MALEIMFAANADYGQQVFGSIYGTVTDAKGGVVPNAKVVITNVSKGTVTEIASDSDGNYKKGQLIPDTYKVTIEATGFSKAVSNVLEVHVDKAAPFDA